MKNNPFVVNNIWKTYDVVMFSSDYREVFYDVPGTDIHARRGIIPTFHITLRNKKHPELIVRTCPSNNKTYKFTRNDGRIGYNTDTANFTWEIFDQTHKCWNKFGTYNWSSVCMKNLTALYYSKLLEFKRKFHQKAVHPRVQKALKNFMDEYIINEITCDFLPSIEMIMGYDLQDIKDIKII